MIMQICKGKVLSISKNDSGELLFQVQMDDGLIVSNARQLSWGGSETRFSIQPIIEGAIVVLIYDQKFIPIILGCIADVPDRQGVGLGISTKPITSDLNSLCYQDTHLSNARASINLGVNGLTLDSDIIRMQLNKLRISHDGSTSDLAINGGAFIDALTYQLMFYVNHMIIQNSVLLSIIASLASKAVLTPQEASALTTTITNSTALNLSEHVPTSQVRDALIATLNQRIELP
jgi:hypothetical protein